MKRKRLPKKRNSRTYSVVIGGHKVHFSVGLYPDGTVGELFIDVAKEGSQMTSLYGIIGWLISKGLQWGIPLSDLARTLKGQKMMPSGRTNDPEVTECESIIDYIFKKLELEYQGAK